MIHHVNSFAKDTSCWLQWSIELEFGSIVVLHIHLLLIVKEEFYKILCAVIKIWALRKSRRTKLSRKRQKKLNGQKDKRISSTPCGGPIRLSYHRRRRGHHHRPLLLSLSYIGVQIYSLMFFTLFNFPIYWFIFFTQIKLNIPT